MLKRKWTIEEIEEYRRMHTGIFYFNKDDSNFFVPKSIGIGWTFNWAHPLSWVFVVIILGLIFWKNVLKS